MTVEQPPPSYLSDRSQDDSFQFFLAPSIRRFLRAVVEYV